jgi:glycosyltransferase involved in cell wall biosynthesis
MKVSIITICYNSEATLNDTIKSVINQDYPNIEYIIVDGCSRDGTMAIIEAHRNRIATVISEPDKGIYDAMNKGVAAATGEVIGILNSDDYYADRHVISDVVAQFHAAPAAQCLYADLIYVDRSDPTKQVRFWQAGPYKRSKFKQGWMPPHPTFFLRKSGYEAHGSYRLELKSAADYELMLRMLYKHQLECTYLPRVITHMRTGGESNVSIKNRIRANREDRRAWTMNGLIPAWYTLTLKPLSKVGQFVRRTKKANRS